MHNRLIICLLILITQVFVLGNTGDCVQLEEAKRIIIDIPSRTLLLMEGETIIKTYPVAVGKRYSQTPTGYFKVLNKVVNPYYKEDNIEGGSEDNPLGSRWIGFKYRYGIHGNSNPDSIGTYASGGCVRMYERDVQELYDSIDISTPVIIKYDLIKVLKDTENESAILLVYRDYYSKERSLQQKVVDKLKELNLYDNIPKERLDKLLNMMKTENVVFSKSWTFFINDNYITEDIIVFDKEFFINKGKLEKFFNIEIPSVYSEDKALINRKVITEKTFDGKKYISLKEIQQILNGELDIDHHKQIIELNAGYFLLNDKLVKGEVYNLTGEPIIPLLPIVREIGLNLRIEDNEIKFMYKDINIDYVVNNGEPYVSIKTLQDKLNIFNEVYTADKTVKLYVNPIVVFEGRVFAGKYVKEELYIPYEIFNSIYTECYNRITSLAELAGDLDVIEIDGRKYIPLEQINPFAIITKNKYNTEIYIKKGNIN